jgi:hypothetical protein
MRLRTLATLALTLTLASSVATAQTSPEPSPKAEPSILTPAETEKILPATVFFSGQTAPVQGRNSAGVRLQNHHLVLTALIDTSGYSSQVQQKYQAYLITESPIEIGDHQLPPGAYGCGFLANDIFVVMDLGAHDIFTAKSTPDTNLRRPKPLQILPSPDTHSSYRLYVGRNYVTFQAVPSI